MISRGGKPPHFFGGITVNETPIIKINGIRYKAKRPKMGAYRQIIWLVDDIGNLSADDFKDEALQIIRMVFKLTEQQADDIDVADVIPTFKALVSWAQAAFSGGVAQFPNEESLQATPGED